MFYLVLGFGLSLPTSLVIALLTYSLLTGAEVYLRRYSEVGTQSRYVLKVTPGIMHLVSEIQIFIAVSHPSFLTPPGYCLLPKCGLPLQLDPPGSSRRRPAI